MKTVMSETDKLMQKEYKDKTFLVYFPKFPKNNINRKTIIVSVVLAV